MSSFDFMHPLDSTIERPPSADAQLSPCSEDGSPEAATQPALSIRQGLLERLFKSHPSRSVAAASSRFSPWLISLAYPLGRRLVVPLYFGRIEVIGRENLPLSGPVILAPTHRSRWDAIMVPYAAGYDVAGRHLRFMVSADEVAGLQGWFIRRMGGFPINTTRPAIASLRYGVDLLHAGETLVIFPEGNIFRGNEINRLKPGLARLALQAEASREDLGIKIVPISLRYSQPFAPWRCQVSIHIGQPLEVSDYAIGSAKQKAQQLTADLYEALKQLMSRSCTANG